MAADVRLRNKNWLAHGTTVVACLLAFQMLYLRMEYADFWSNAGLQVIAFVAVVLVHLMARPHGDPKFRKATRRLVLGTVVAMALFLLVGFIMLAAGAGGP
jgi:hypothetical protein